MKIIFSLLVLIHGLLHSLGAIQGLGLKNFKELSLPISKTFGVIWLMTTLLFIIYLILYLSNIKIAWLLGFAAVICSQVVIIYFWQDAKFGTIPNIIILTMAMIQFGTYRFQKEISRETNELISENKKFEQKIVTEEDLADLPEPVRNWLLKSKIVGKPFIHFGKVIQSAKMKMKPEQEKWMDAQAEQYTFIDEPAFIWSVRAKMNGLLFFLGRDKFANGQGEMLIKLNSLFSVVNEKGFKIDEGAMQRYLGEMVWFPSMALSPYITWEQIDDHAAKATMDYNGRKCSGIFHFNDDSDFTKYTAMRFKGNEETSKRHEWVLLVQEYAEFEGIRIPSLMTATWKLETENWTWLELEIHDIMYNEHALAN